MSKLLEIKECRWKDEIYLVREDGFIYRMPKEGSRKRKLDERWTPGSVDASTGYCKFGTERAHLIVATAFHGERDTKKFIVEHIDGNRAFNAPSNLRWVSKLQAALDNPDNIQKLLIYFPNGLQEFLDNPSLLKQRGCVFPEISWMAGITSSEAKEAYAASKNENLESFHNPIVNKPDRDSSDEKFEPFKEGENIAEFLRYSERETKHHSDMGNFLAFIPEEEDWKCFMTESPTPLVLQDNWITPTEFPYCPDNIDGKTLTVYHDSLPVNGLFCKNEKWESQVLEKALSEDKTKLWVLTENPEGPKKWALSKIYIKEGYIVHCAVRTFFSKEGAEKEFTLIQGKEWNGEDSIDDYC